MDPFGLANNSYGKSQKKYGHARSEHGAQRHEQALRDRARTKKTDQGHFKDNKMIEEAFDIAPKTSGVHDVQVSVEGNVYHPDGSTSTTKTVRVIITDKKATATPITAYPFTP